MWFFCFKLPYQLIGDENGILFLATVSSYLNFPFSTTYSKTRNQLQSNKLYDFRASNVDLIVLVITGDL